MINKTLRATMALALSLIGVSSVVAPEPAPEKAAKPPTFDKRPGQEAPEPHKFGGGGPQNTNPDGPAAPGGPVYRKVWDPDTKSMGWRAFSLALYYRAADGQIHAYQPGQDENRDKAFPAMAKKLGLQLLSRADRRALHREERARYQAIQRKRAMSPTEV